MIQTATPIFTLTEEESTRTVAINEVSTSEATATGTAAEEIILDVYPEAAVYLERIDTTDKTTVQILTEIQTIADEENDDSIDVSTVDISEVHYGHLFIEEVADLTIQTAVRARITISADGTPMLDNIYTPGMDGLIHLDLRDLILYYTGIPLPELGDDVERYLDPEESGVYLTIAVTHADNSSDEYELWVNAFKRDLLEKMSDFDRIDLPADARIPMAVYRDNNLSNAPVNVTFVSASRRQLLHTGAIGDGDGFLVSADVPVSLLPYRQGEPFYLEFEIATERIYENGAAAGYVTRKVRTPVYRVTGQPAELYFFLNDYGNYDVIAMTGKLSAAPEFEIENAFRTSSIERVKATRKGVYTQNSGPLSRESVVVLSSLLLSRRIFYYVPGAGSRRIVIENPSVNLASSQSINTVTFSWRYADK